MSRQRLTGDQRSEIRLRHFCGESMCSIAKVVGTTYHGVRRLVDPIFLEYSRARAREYYRHRIASDPAWRRTVYHRDRLRRKGAGRIIYERERLLKKRGMSEKDYEVMFQRQNGCCAICLRPQRPGRNREHLFIDHCHKTNRTRGLLCMACNHAIGFLGDDPQVLQRAIAYLEEHE